MKKLITFLAFITFAINTFAVITITPTSLDTAYCQHNYSIQFKATGGTAPYTFRVSAGTTPAGMQLGLNTGVLGGITGYIRDTSFSITIQARDAKNVNGTHVYTFYIRNTKLSKAELVNVWTINANQPPARAQVYDTWYNSITGTVTPPTNLYWNLGGNTNATLRKFGTLNNFDLPVYTNGIQRAVFKSTGFFGIGHNSPTAMLDIKAKTMGNNGFTILTRDSANTQTFLLRDDGEFIIGSGSTISNGGLVNIHGNSNSVGSYSSFNANPDDYFRINDATNPKLYMGYSANGGTIQAYSNPLLLNGLGNFVGVGAVTVPTAELHIKASGTTTTFGLKVTDSGTNLNFSVRDDGRINMLRIPSDSTGLSTGDLYRSGVTGNIIMVKY